MRKKFEFGKVDGYRNGVKNCPVEIEVSLSDGCFSASGSLYNHRRTDILMGGQCIDDLANEYPALKADPVFEELRSLWHLYHLNDMKAGTPEQEEEVKSYFKSTGRAYDYTEAVEHLKSAGLYEVKVDFQEKPYRYGSAWLKEEIPEEDAKEIEAVLSKEGRELREFCWVANVSRGMVDYAPTGYLPKESAFAEAELLAKELPRGYETPWDVALEYGKDWVNSELEYDGLCSEDESEEEERERGYDW